jgi:hypothetical protein
MSPLQVDVQEWLGKDCCSYVVKNKSLEPVNVKVDKFSLQGCDLFYSFPASTTIPSGKSCLYKLYLKKEEQQQATSQCVKTVLNLKHSFRILAPESKQFQEQTFSRTITMFTSKPFALHLSVQIEE